MKSYDSEHFRAFTKKSEFDKALHELNGILIGIAIDEKINQKEIQELQSWIKTYHKILNYYPYKEIYEVILNAIDDNIIDDEEKQNLEWITNKYINSSVYYVVVTSDIQRLQGIFHGILSDNVITDEEIIKLDAWLEDNSHLIGHYPYDEVCSLITSILADHKITDEEKNHLKVFFSEFILEDTHSIIDFNEIQKLKQSISFAGVCTTNPQISFSNKQFCFTGKSNKSDRDEIIKTIKSLDGIYINSVSSKTNYLVYGDGGSPCWAYSCYGRKVEQAVNLRKNNHAIQIVYEADFWDAVEDYL
jgi:NAD-dependent DNA ligase